MTSRTTPLRFCLAFLAALIASGATAAAQTPADGARSRTDTMPNAFQGLGMGSDKPIQFEAEALEVRDQENQAIFTGNVVVKQEQTVLKSERLVVFYAPRAEGTPATQGGRQVERLEASGKVLVTSGPMTASGDNGTFDTAANTIVLTGSVVLTQGENVIRGPRLVVDVNTGQARMEGGRVQMLIEPNSIDKPSNGG